MKRRAIGGALVIVLAGSSAVALLGPQAVGGAPAKPAAPAPVSEAPGDYRPEAVVAKINGKEITLADVQKPLIEAHGLKVLLGVAQLNLAKQKAAEQGINLTPADYAAELDRTMKAAFQDADKADYPALLAQLLQKQGISETEWAIIIQMNATLRKIAEPDVRKQVADKIGDDKLLEAFNAMFGQTAVVRHIQCVDAQSAQLAINRIAAGEQFENVVRAMSQNFKTRELQGELPQFSRQTESWGPGWGKVPQSFKAWAFGGAKAGDISGIIQAEGSFHVLKLDRVNAPKVVKFEDEKERIRERIVENAMEQAMRELKVKLAAMTKQSLVVNEPVMGRQYKALLEEQEKQTKSADAERARQDLLKGKTPQKTEIRNPIDPIPLKGAGPDGASSTPQLPGGLTPPTDASTGERPPATKSAAPGAADVPPTPAK